MMRFFHPQMIAQCANKPGPTIDQMIDFVIAGLAPRGDGGTQLTFPSLRAIAKQSIVAASCDYGLLRRYAASQ